MSSWHFRAIIPALYRPEPLPYNDPPWSIKPCITPYTYLPLPNLQYRRPPTIDGPLAINPSINCRLPSSRQMSTDRSAVNDRPGLNDMVTATGCIYHPQLAAPIGSHFAVILCAFALYGKGMFCDGFVYTLDCLRRLCTALRAGTI